MVLLSSHTAAIHRQEWVHELFFVKVSITLSQSITALLMTQHAHTSAPIVKHKAATPFTNGAGTVVY